MKITFVLKCASMDGGTRVVAIYADRLARRGHEVRVVSMPADRWSLRRKLRWLATRGAWPKGPRLGRNHLEAFDIDHRVIDRCRPVTAADVPDADVVIATWWETAQWVSDLPPGKGAKCFFVQGDERQVVDDTAAVEAAWRLPMAKIAVSRWLASVAQGEFGDGSVVCVPNSVDTSMFHAPPRRRASVPTVGMLYATAWCKGCDVSLAALAEVRRRMPALRLVSFGPGAVEPRLPLIDGAAYTQDPAQDRLRELYAECDVWLSGSRAEGFGLPCLEAMACRCPVVSTRSGGPEDIVEDGVNGYLVDVDDVGALAERLARVWTMDGSDWLAMSDAALATARRYTWDDATDRFEAALRRIASGGSSPAAAPKGVGRG